MDKAERITNESYKAYGSDSGYLLGIMPGLKDSVKVIVKFTLDYDKGKGEIS